MKRMRGSLMPGPAMIVALVALVIALSGVGYAATVVGTGQIRDGAVTTPKLHDGAVGTAKLARGAVTSAKVKNGTLLAADFKPGVLQGGTVQGAPGPQGPAGPAGPQGLPGGVSGYTVVMGDLTTAEPSPTPGIRYANAVCAPGSVAVGGGYDVGYTGLEVVTNWPSFENVWSVGVRNPLVAAASFRAWAVCVTKAS